MCHRINHHMCATCADTTTGSMSDEEFSNLVAACNKELAAKQNDFMKLIEGGGKWYYDLNDCSLTIGMKRFRITPVGTFSSSNDTWLWAWANEDFPTAARDASKQLHILHEITGWQVFINPGTSASSADAQIFSALSVHVMEAIGFFKSQNEAGPILYMAVHEPTT